MILDAENENSTMPLPDFIIGGAPKCGTTALFRYLDQHPEIFTSKPKEPHFFATDSEELMGVNYDREQYEALFDEAGENQLSGESSTWYINHAKKVAPKIHELIPNVRLIFLLRNKIERDYSDYWYHILRGNLPLKDPISCYISNPGHWIFDSSKSYLRGLKTFYSHFREEQILVLLTDDLRENSKECSVGSVSTLVSGRIIASISRPDIT